MIVKKAKPRPKKRTSKINLLKFMYLNACSINASTALGDRHVQVLTLLDLHQPHFMVVTETWLNKDKKPPRFPGYTLAARQDKASESGVGGGVCIYKMSSLKTTKPNTPNLLPLSQVCSVKYRDLLIQCVYRGHGQRLAEDELLWDVLRSTPAKNRIVLGDFNHKEAFTPTYKPTAQANAMKEAFEEMCFTQIIEEPTRKGNVLDLVFLSRIDLLKNKQVVSDYLSDHDLILFDLSAPAFEGFEKRVTYDRKKLNVDQMKEDLARKLERLPPDIRSNEECNEFANILHGSISETLFQHLEEVKKVVVVDVNFPYYTPEIRRLQRLKRKCWNKYASQRSKTLLERFQYVKRILEIKIMVAQKKYEHDLVTSFDQSKRRFFNYVAASRSERQQIGPLLADGVLLYEDAAMAEHLVDFYSAACTPLVEYHGSFTHPPGVPVMDDVNITEYSVFMASKQLKKGKAASYDAIRADDLLMFMEVIVEHFTKLFYYCYHKGFSIDHWNTALVVPLLKPDKPVEEAASHRQVSVLPSSYKWYEIIVFKPWMKFVYDKGLMPRQQHGAQKARSTMTNVLQLMAFATPNYEATTMTFLCSLDQKSAFDRLSYSCLVQAALQFGMPAKAVRGLYSMFMNRSIVVRVGEAVSTPRRMISGCHQGSLLSPQIFAAAFASVLNGLSSVALVYVDDLSVMVAVKSDEDCEKFQDDLNNINDWCVERGAMISSGKSTIVKIGQPSWPFYDKTFSIQGSEIPVVNMQKHLGVLISNDLSAVPQMKATVSSLARKSYQIKRAFRSRSAAFLSKMWMTYLASSVEYSAILVNLQENIGLQRKLCRIQKHFFSGVTFAEGQGPNCILRRIKHLRLSFAHKLYHGHLNVDRESILNIPKNDTRLKFEGCLTLSKTRTNAGLRVFGNSIAKEWNELPLEVRNDPLVGKFKNYLKNKHYSTRVSQQREASARFAWSEQTATADGNS